MHQRYGGFRFVCHPKNRFTRRDPRLTECERPEPQSNPSTTVVSREEPDCIEKCSYIHSRL